MAEDSALRHSQESLVTWLESARDTLAKHGHPGFNLQTDAPHLLLAIERMTPADFAMLMQLTGECADGPDKRVLQDCLFAGWSRKDPRSALAWTRERRPDKFNEAVKVLSKSNASGAWEAWTSLPGQKDRDGETLNTLFANWAKQDRTAALEALLTIKPQDRTAANLGFFSSSIPDRKKSPQEWMDFREEIAQRIMEITDPGDRVSAASSLLNALYERNSPAMREEMAGWLEKQPLSERDRVSLLTGMAQWEGCDPSRSKEAFSWLWKTVPVSSRGVALASIVEYWASGKPWSARDPDACGRWLNEQPNLGPECDPALKAFALHAAAKDPGAGLEWAKRVSEPAVRAASIHEVSALILKQWPNRAAELGVAEQP
jgi:hypothetical protein